MGVVGLGLNVQAIKMRSRLSCDTAMMSAVTGQVGKPSGLISGMLHDTGGI